MQVCKQLEHIFRILNMDIFKGRLPIPIFTIFVIDRKHEWYFQVRNQKQYVIALNQKELEKSEEEIICNMLHCMVHEYCKLFGIQESSREGRYHNIKFGESAEAHGLIVKKTSEEGYITIGIQESVKKLIRQKFTDLRKNMDIAIEMNSKTLTINTKAAYTTIWECPICHAKAKASHNAKLYCGYCMVAMNRT